MNVKNTFARWSERDYCQAFAAAGAAIHGTPAGLLTANTVPYHINGIFYSAAADASVTFPAGMAVQAAGTKRNYVMVADKAGAITLLAESADAPYCPMVPDTHCPIALIQVETDAATAFTPGTTDLDASGVTTTIHDISQLPPDPSVV